MAEHLRADVGINSAAFTTLWREKTLECSFRRGLMQRSALILHAGRCWRNGMPPCPARSGGCGEELSGLRRPYGLAPATAGGFTIARCTVAGLMGEMRLASVVRGKPARTTASDRSTPCQEDRVNRQFRAPRPNALLVCQANGFRKNFNIDHDIYDLFAQASVTPELNIQTEFSRRRSHEDLEQMLRMRMTRVVLAAAHLDHDPATTGSATCAASVSPATSSTIAASFSARRIIYLLRRASGDPSLVRSIHKIEWSGQPV